MQAAALVSSVRATHYQFCGLYEIAKFDKVVSDAEVAVVLVDLARQKLDTVAGAFQSLVGANNANIVPHESAQLVPIVRNDDRLVCVGDAAFVPLREGR